MIKFRTWAVPSAQAISYHRGILIRHGGRKPVSVRVVAGPRASRAATELVRSRGHRDVDGDAAVASASLNGVFSAVF